MIALDHRTAQVVDVSARVIAFAACAALWWIWVTLALSATISIASSTRLDVSPGALLAGAAVVATVLVGIGLVLTHVLFAYAHIWSSAALLVVVAHRRAVVRGVVRVVVVTMFIVGSVTAVVALFVAYWIGLAQSIALVVFTADHIESVTFEATIDAATALGAAFGRMYLSLLILFVGVRAPYVALKRSWPRVSAAATSLE